MCLSVSSAKKKKYKQKDVEKDKMRVVVAFLPSALHGPAHLSVPGNRKHGSLVACMQGSKGNFITWSALQGPSILKFKHSHCSLVCCPKQSVYIYIFAE